ncbi:MAG: hypothetical protein U5O15_08105 [Candidatus Krumholzibacteriota bacterium]|nr:hypothetical protein [Candidatus Krumholzibacteriota bacterium]
MKIRTVKKGWNVEAVDPVNIAKRTVREMDFNCGDYDSGKLSDQNCGLEDRV